jgi:hypothetical protein
MTGPDRQGNDDPRLGRSGPSGARGSAAAAGWMLSGSVIGCLALGYVAGEHFDWNPAATLVGLFAGIATGLYNLARAMRRER